MFLKPLPPLPINIPHRLAYSEVPKGSFLVHPIAGPNFSLLATTIHSSLRATCENKYFSRHLIYSVPAAVLSISLLLYNTFVSAAAFYISCFVLAGILFLNFSRYARDLVKGRIRNSQRAAYLLVLLTLYMGWIAMLASETKQYTNTFEFTLIFAVVLNIFLPAWLRTPSETGRLLLNQIEGYREFLTRVEVDKMHQLNDPNWAPGEKTRNLSYAVALDLHNAWQDYLANSDFHSVASEPSKTRPTLRGMQPLGSGPNAVLWGLVYRNGWRIGVFLLISLLADLLIPSDFYYPRLAVTFVIGGLVALSMPRPFRSE